MRRGSRWWAVGGRIKARKADEPSGLLPLLDSLADAGGQRMTPLPMRPLADNCTTAVDSLSRGNFRGLRAGCFPCVLGRFFRAWACFACMPGPPTPAARSPPQRTRPLAPFPGWGRAGGWGEAPVVPRDAQRPRRGHCVAKPYAEGRQAAEPVRFRGVCPAGQCPHGAHSEKSAAGGALPGAYAQQCAPGDAVMGAAGVASWMRRRSSAAQAPRLRGAGR